MPNLPEPYKIGSKTNQRKSGNEYRSAQRDILRNREDGAGEQDKLGNRKKQKEPILSCWETLNSIGGVLVEKKIDEKQQDRFTTEVRKIPPDVWYGEFSEVYIDCEGRKQ